MAFITGTSGNDTLPSPLNEANTINGLDGNDTIGGGNLNDFISGGNGDDDIIGGAGSDTIYGDAGSDWIHGQDGADFLYGGASDDELYGGAGNDQLTGNGGYNYLSGDGGNDTYIHNFTDAGISIIYDNGGASDQLTLQNLSSTLNIQRSGTDLYLYTDADAADGALNNYIQILDFYGATATVRGVGSVEVLVIGSQTYDLWGLAPH